MCVRAVRACVRVLGVIPVGPNSFPASLRGVAVGFSFAGGVFLGERVIVCCDYFHSVVLWPAFTSVKGYVWQWRPKQPIKEHIIIITTVFVCPESVA